METIRLIICIMSCASSVISFIAFIMAIKLLRMRRKGDKLRCRDNVTSQCQTSG